MLFVQNGLIYLCDNLKYNSGHCSCLIFKYQQILNKNVLILK